MIEIDPDKAPFGYEVRKLRVAAGRRQREVAEVLGNVSVPYVHDIERGHRNPPTLEKIHDLAALFNAPEKGDHLAELAVVQRGSINIIPKNPFHRRLLVVLDRQIRNGRVTKAKAEQIIKLIDD
jgi:transcriptional regulator with XRE-family HTH domain